jgi:hypothetical protein
MFALWMFARGVFGLRMLTLWMFGGGVLSRGVFSISLLTAFAACDEEGKAADRRDHQNSSCRAHVNGLLTDLSGFLRRIITWVRSTVRTGPPVLIHDTGLLNPVVAMKYSRPCRDWASPTGRNRRNVRPSG